VLWASLVDDPSSWPDKFPTEEDQSRERQRLFDILGRIVIEVDKKGNQKQVVRGLVSWDEVNDPQSKALEAAQREIARCLAWDRGEEPPTKPDAVREYIAKYAPPAYDPFAGGGSIPLEAQRLGLQAHASDLNPVAVLINKALIEIPPKFKDLLPVNPVSRGQGIGNRGQEDERGSIAPGSNCLAEVDGSGGASLSTERSLSEGGDVSPNQSDHTSSNLDSGEHSRGKRAGNSQGLRQFSGDRQRVVDGNRDVSNVGSSSQLSNPARSRSNPGIDCGNQQDAYRPSQASTSALNPPVTGSLFPLPYKGAQGLAADVRFYGAWMRERAFERIGHLYPKVKALRLADGSYQAWSPPHPPAPSPTGGEGEQERWEISDALSKKMTEVARQLRKQETQSEEILWQALRGAKLEGRKFRRQQPIGCFVVDFFCAAERLIVEVDGAVHDLQQELDRERQMLLESLGLRFLRLSAHAVETDLFTCLKQIEAAFTLHSPGFSPLSPRGRGAGGEGAKAEELTVIAWLWARTVKCPNPACSCQMPLVRSFQLSTKKGKEAWVEPVVEYHPHPLTPSPIEGEGEQENPTPSPIEGEGEQESPTPLSPRGRGAGGEGVRVKFVVKSGQGKAPDGTVDRKGARCIACETPVPFDHVRQEGRAGRMGVQLMAIVAEGQNGRVYLSPQQEHVEIANSAQPTWKPDADLPHNPRDFKTPNYGMKKISDLFTPRQLVALTTFSDLVAEAREKATQDAVAAGLADDDVPLAEGGMGARAYGDAIATYLAFVLSKVEDRGSTLGRWDPTPTQSGVINTFSRQALPMTWDYAETNPLGDASGSFTGSISWVIKVLENHSGRVNAKVYQHDATAPHPHDTTPKLISTDPPYYDNIGYADLSDFFYVWLRRSLGSIYPNICSTLLVPKAQELVATPYRFDGSKQKAQAFFEEGLGKAFNRMHKISHADYPLTVYYAFKQAETDQKGKSDESVASTGWETMLEGLIKADFSINGTWPMRSELSNRMVASGTNALASSIVLVCRPRPTNAPKITRRQFLTELKRELPQALKTLQQGNVAPVDLAQASIGPGMAVFSQYAAVLENDGSPMRVRTALQLINQILDEFLTEQEGEFDGDTRWALTWFEQYQFEPGQYGDAETLSKAKNTSVQGMVEAGILEAKGGKVRLLSREGIGSRKQGIGSRKQGIGKSDDSVPSSLSSVPSSPDWLITQTLIHELDQKGEMGAAELLANLGNRREIARDLAYRLYSLCDRKGWTQEAISYNSLVISWPEINRLASDVKTRDPIQTSLL
jgi:putative DNA methylase